MIMRVVGLFRAGRSISRACIFSSNRVFIARLLCSQTKDQWKAVLDFWFGPGGGLQKWFRGGPKVDQEIQEKFGLMVDNAHQGAFQEWEQEPKPSLALIILIDQFSRNIYRGTPKATASDARARSIARKFLEGKSHNHLQHSVAERTFIYMPFEHSEDKKDQELCVDLLTKLVQDVKGTDEEETAANFLEFAMKHKEVIDMFGRYPQRNEELGRQSTPEEEVFLRELPEQYKW